MLSPDSVLGCVSLLVSVIGSVCIHRVIKKSNSINVIRITQSYSALNYKIKTGTNYSSILKKKCLSSIII